MIFRWQEKSWSKEHVAFQTLTHQRPAWIYYLGPLRVSLEQKLHYINFLLQNNFKHRKYKKEEGHEPYISSFGINNYKTNLLVPQVVMTSDCAISRWWTTEFAVKTFLTCIRSFSSCYVLICCGGREGQIGRIREKKRERILPSWGTTIKTPFQLEYLSKALLPNTITLGVKGGHNSIHSSYA